MNRYFALVPLCLLLISSCAKKENTNSPEEPPQLRQVLCVPVTTDADWYTTDNKAPLIDGLDVLSFPVTTNSELAQKYVNQGLVLAYGFNHAEAARSFHYATKLDSACAMAYWGYAFVLGPNYNAGMEPDNYQRAYDAIQQAVALAGSASAKEQALINALGQRYSKEVVADRSSLDVAFSEAMKTVHEAFPEDADIATICAESIMDLHPWDLWDKAGNPKEWTLEISSLLEKALVINPKHAGAHHFNIHLVEASLEPEKGLESAQVFDEDLVPGAGHLVHMPSHIYIRTGDYHKGTLANIRAVKVDSNYVTSCHAQGAYPLAYYPHNYHFMAATATLEGNSKWALKAADEVSAHSNTQLMKEPGWGTIQHYYTIPYYVYAKFGEWEKVLKMTNADTTLKYPEAVRNYARGMAYLGLDDLENAKKELVSLEKYAADESLKEVTIWDINSVDVLLQIAQRVLKAEILASEGQFEESIVLLKEAVGIEDNLNYNEPPDWFFSVRHHLGSVQVEAGKYEEAIRTFEEDLARLPKNGWALHGMKAAYAKLNDEMKVAEVTESLSEIWATADIELTTARLK
ncbi:hypothetical protein R9C00_20780 [Flammeovirgaceae bacterium SG7u.111]|nr:hypothetical protein [Flammeovirgaceae bacterium SG7u.132]WPO34138.1 hypothetical protein R9C00_20780 [Flammeovirgaceae bacterium SG7u.111]